MASVLAGFRPVKHINGSPYNGQLNRYMIPAAETAVVNVGDFVQLSDAAAIVDPITGGVYPAVERMTSSTAASLVGAVVGFEVDYSNLNTGGAFRPASTYKVVLVADSPDIIFAGPQDAVGGVVAAASVGLNVAVTLGSGSTTAPYASGMSVDSSTVATAATLPLQVVGVTAVADNDVTSTARPAELLVRINTHAFGSVGVAGV